MVEGVWWREYAEENVDRALQVEAGLALEGWRHLVRYRRCEQVVLRRE